jgi:hypothetical protein
MTFVVMVWVFCVTKNVKTDLIRFLLVNITMLSHSILMSFRIKVSQLKTLNVYYCVSGR